MSRDFSFIILCINEYKNQKNDYGHEVTLLFDIYNVVDYIRDFYDGRHTTWSKYIFNDIHLYIKSCIA